AKRAADHHCNFWHNRITDRVNQFRAVTNNPTLLSVLTDHEPGDVLKENDRQSGLVAVHDEPRGLVGAVGVNHAAHLDSFFFGAHLQTLIRDDANCATADS